MGSPRRLNPPVEPSPLAQVERAVQERAKAISLDMQGTDGLPRLRQLVEEEVAQWTEDFKRGRREFDLADPDAVAERAWRNIAGYGPLEPLLADDDVWEIMIRGFVIRPFSRRRWSEHILCVTQYRRMTSRASPLRHE